MRFPQTFIEDLKRQADIVRVISDYVQLKKKGANWMACCPFHGEKTPSFSVNPTKGFFKCFGCSKGGDAVTFVMEMERLSFPEAVKLVAEKSGVPLPEMETDGKSDEQRRADEERRRTTESVLELNAFALEWWEEQLQAETAEARAAREYVARRGISDETRAVFRLGFAPDRWDGLLNHLKSRGASEKQIETSGLVVKKDTGGVYDRFRGRLIFPVLDVRGRAVAFGGRTMTPDGEPKYLNSPETPAYTKGRHLYGLHQAVGEIKKRRFVILVEGYLDLVIPYQYGVRNVVASLGTALTEAQAKLLGRFARKIVVNYDGDKAGRAAARRATEVLLTEDFETKVLVLPDNADPDEFIQTRGVEEYQRRRGEAVSFIQFVLDEALRERNLGNAAEKDAAVAEVLPFVRAVKSSIQRQAAFDEAMVRLMVDPASRAELAKTVSANAQRAVASFGNRMSHGDASSQQQQQRPQGRPASSRADREQPTPAEQQLLEILINDAELSNSFAARIENEDFAGMPTELIFRRMKESVAQGTDFDLSALTEELPDDSPLNDFIALLMISELPPELERAAGEADDAILARAESCLSAMRLMSVDKRLRRLVAEIAAAERAGNTESLQRLTMENLELTRRRTALLPQASDYAYTNTSNTR
jgi:DNA primase